MESPALHQARYYTFEEVTEPIAAPVTEFGGNPVWLGEPQWPIHPKTGEPLLSVGQVELDPLLFGALEGRLAYVFVTGPDALKARVSSQWQQNAVVIQPGGVGEQPSRPLREGPSVCRVEDVKRRWWSVERVLVPAEYRVETALLQEPTIDWEDDDPLAALPFDVERSKSGGQPVWIQGEQWPYEQPTALLLQLVWGDLPFYLSLGDAGTLYVCLSPDGREGRMVWQCG